MKFQRPSAFDHKYWHETNQERLVFSSNSPEARTIYESVGESFLWLMVGMHDIYGQNSLNGIALNSFTFK
jgi:hypothetical protein